MSYGIEITGPNGTTTVFGSSLRQMNAVATNASKVVVVTAKNNPTFFSNQGVNLTRSTASGGTITLTNASTASITIKVSIYRIS